MILRSATVIDGTGSAAFGNGEITIEDGVIRSVGKAAEKPPEGGRLVDFGDATILPGLIDGHVHLQFDAGATTPEVVHRHTFATDAELAMRALGNAQQALGAGVTTVRDCGGRLDLNTQVRAAIDSGEAAGPRVLVSGAPITTTSGHLHWCGLIADTEDEIRFAVRRMAQAGVDFIKVMATGGGMTPISNALRPQYSREALTALVEDARRLNMRVAAHTLAADGCEYAIDAGVSTFEHFRWSVDGGIDYRPEAIDRFDFANQSINSTYTSFDRDRFSAYSCLDDVPKESTDELRDRYWFIRDAADRGATVTTSSDSGVPNAAFGSFALSVIAGMVAMAVSAELAIAQATSLQAKAIGISDEIGSIEPGKQADILVVEGDASANIFALRKPVAVFRDGREVVRDGRLEILESERALAIAAD